ncbi:unnamed protein product [Arabis nemorensis]|uniref:Uncharacterized protein n=1 Tax=Arabis nemorensis TaxID=586526 RepID=A0A565BJU9_9BRAS|nr:unnamed protein product [Arabis nemorensis]
MTLFFSQNRNRRTRFDYGVSRYFLSPIALESIWIREEVWVGFQRLRYCSMLFGLSTELGRDEHIMVTYRRLSKSYHLDVEEGETTEARFIKI